ATQSNPFFTGLPMPAAAYLVVLPMMLSFDIGDGWARSPGVNSVVIVLASALMVSRLPTPSIKYMHVPKRLRVAAFIVACALAALLINWPWAALSGGFAFYAASIPIGLLRHAYDEEDEQGEAETE